MPRGDREPDAAQQPQWQAVGSGSPAEGDCRPSVVVGVDSSARSLDAARLAGQLATRLEASLVLVHALDSSLRMLGATEAEAAETAEGILASIGAEGEVRIEWGTASHALESVAAENGTRLIVIGARGMGALQAAALGSVRGELLRHSRHPLVVLPEHADAACVAGPGHAEQVA